MRGVIFVSRKKDNPSFAFKSRKKAFLSDKSIEDLMQMFEQFVSEGKSCELSRFYLSVNERDNSKLIGSLEHYLLDHPDFALDNIMSKDMGLAMCPENAKTHKWLFEYNRTEHILDFREDLLKAGFTRSELTIYKTANNYSIVVDHGFDCRKLLEKYPDCKLKRDAWLCVALGNSGPNIEPIDVMIFRN